MGTLLILLGRHDERVLHALVLRRRALLDRGMRALTHLGDARVVVPLVLLLLLVGAPGAVRDAADEAAFALVASHLWVQALKRTVTRPRPRLPIGRGFLIEPPDRFSFPSGHAAATLSVALPLAAVVPSLLSLPLLLLALLVGLSRCYLGVHYPGDVAAGWALAWLAARVAGPALALLAP